MTQEQAKQMWPIIKAWSEGKVIQHRLNQTHSWYDSDSRSNYSFDKNPENYRIKPEPKLRPWKPEEVPVGALLKNKSYRWVCLIIGRTNCEISTPIFNSNNTCTTYEDALQFFEHSLDHGKTWLPCGVMEE